MTLDEEIKYCEEVAEFNIKEVENGNWRKDSMAERYCIECANERLQLAEWLKELKAYKEQQPCDDVISREDALKALCQAVHKNDDNIPCPNQRVSCLWNKTKVQDYAEEILKLPPVTPQQKIGRWIPTSDISKWGYKCSECEGIDNTDLGHFCKWCGVKMVESQESSV